MATHKIREKDGSVHFMDDDEYKAYKRKGCFTGCLTLVGILALLFIISMF